MKSLEKQNPIYCYQLEVQTLESVTAETGNMILGVWVVWRGTSTSFLFLKTNKKNFCFLFFLVISCLGKTSF